MPRITGGERHLSRYGNAGQSREAPAWDRVQAGRGSRLSRSGSTRHALSPIRIPI